MKFSVIFSTLVLACSAVALPSLNTRDDVAGQSCINQDSGDIYIQFQNIDVEQGSSFKVKIGSLNTGNIASNFAGASSVVVDQTSGDIFVVFDDIQVDKGSTFSVNVGSINTGNLAIVQGGHGHHHKPTKG